MYLLKIKVVFYSSHVPLISVVLTDNSSNDDDDDIFEASEKGPKERSKLP